MITAIINLANAYGTPIKKEKVIFRKSMLKLWQVKEGWRNGVALLGLERTLIVVPIADRAETEQVWRQCDPQASTGWRIYIRVCKFKKELVSMPAVLVFARQRLEELGIQASLDYTAIFRPVWVGWWKCVSTKKLKTIDEWMNEWSSKLIQTTCGHTSTQWDRLVYWIWVWSQQQWPLSPDSRLPTNTLVLGWNLAWVRDAFPRLGSWTLGPPLVLLLRVL